MGFADAPRQTTADYLTGCTDANERRYAKGRNASNVPSTAEEMAKFYRDSPVFKSVREDMDSWERTVKETNPHEDFEKAVLQAKGRGTRKTSKYQVSFFRQVVAIAQRQTLLKYVISPWVLMTIID